MEYSSYYDVSRKFFEFPLKTVGDVLFFTVEEMSFQTFEDAYLTQNLS